MSIENDAKDILETGNIRQFEEFLVHNSDKIDIKHEFNDRDTFLIVLVQTFRNMEANLISDRSQKLPVDDFKNCMAFLVEIGCDLNAQDISNRTVGHWCVLLEALELLGVALRLGCNSCIQDNEGQTIVHLAIRHNNQMALETIKLYSDAEDNAFECSSETSGATPLIYAVQIGSVDLVKKLLQLNVKVDSQEQNKYKRTALHYALFTDNEEIFELLLKFKAKSDIKDYKDKSVVDRVAEHPKDSFLRIITHYSSSEIFSNEVISTYSPILIACKNNDFDMLSELLSKVKDVRELLVTDNSSRTALHYCNDNRDIRCAKKLLELQPQLIGMTDENGFSALHLATIANNLELIKLLIRSDADVCQQDNDGHTSLHWAVVCSTKDTIGLLVSSNQDIVNKVDNHGASALHYATQAFLSPDGNIQGRAILEEILSLPGVDVDCMDKEGRTALLWSASLGLVECCSILLEHDKTNMMHKDANGLSILHCAASRGNYEVCEMLLHQYEFPVDTEDNNLCTALFYAVTLHHRDICELLMDSGANPNQQDIKGRSISHCAALKGYCDILELIKAKGGSLCLVNKQGDLPLHEASQMGHEDVCRTLLSKMEQCGELEDHLNALNKEGLSPLHLAARNNHDKVCRVLLESGAQIDLQSSQKFAVDPNHPGKFLCPVDMATDASTIQVFQGGTGALQEPQDCAAEDPVKVSCRRGSWEVASQCVDKVTVSRSNSVMLREVNDVEFQLMLKGLVEYKQQHSTDAGNLEIIVPEFTYGIVQQNDGMKSSLRSLRMNRPVDGRTKVISSTKADSSGGSSSLNSEGGKSTRRSRPTHSPTGRQGKRDLRSEVHASVRQYLDCKQRMQRLTDQKRSEMFQGYSRSLELSSRYTSKARSGRQTNTRGPSNGNSSRPNNGTSSTTSNPRVLVNGTSARPNNGTSSTSLPVIYTSKPTTAPSQPRNQRSKLHNQQIKATYRSQRLVIL